MQKLIPAFAGVPVVETPAGSRNESPKFSNQISAMLSSGIRGRGLGRGVPAPAATPASHGGGHETPPPAQPHESASALPHEFLDYVEAMGQNIVHLREQMNEMKSELSAINHRGSDSSKVFDALHAELNDYKRDFIYEHMKPLLRPLLFLYDSLESFDREMALYENAQAHQNLPADALKGSKVRQNISFLRDQLIEALQVCDVEPMPVPSGLFDAKTQKAIDTVTVAPELDGTIVQVVRNAWTMQGHILRPAEVVIGKSPKTAIGEF